LEVVEEGLVGVGEGELVGDVLDDDGLGDMSCSDAIRSHSVIRRDLAACWDCRQSHRQLATVSLLPCGTPSSSEVVGAMRSTCRRFGHSSGLLYQPFCVV
jgi:hypothetical protein